MIENEKKEEIKTKQNENINLYQKSLEALIEYMKNNEENPSEKTQMNFLANPICMYVCIYIYILL